MQSFVGGALKLPIVRFVNVSNIGGGGGRGLTGKCFRDIVVGRGVGQRLFCPHPCCMFVYVTLQATSQWQPYMLCSLVDALGVTVLASQAPPRLPSFRDGLFHCMLN